MMQFPAPHPHTPPSHCTNDVEKGDWLKCGVLELTYASSDMTSFAAANGDTGRLFRWNKERRALLLAERDAAVFHLYGVPRDDVDHVLETFPIVKRDDLAAHGTYRTKDLILNVYDRMAEAEKSGTPYRTLIDPPPGHGPRHPAKPDTA